MQGSTRPKKQLKIKPFVNAPYLAALVTRARGHLFVGIDNSLLNPGVCTVDPIRKRISLYFWRNRRHDKTSAFARIHTPDSPFAAWLVETVCMEHTVVTTGTRTERYLAKTYKIVSVVHNLQVLHPTATLILAIEGYAYGAQHTTSSIALAELGGCLRMLLFLTLPHVRCIELAPTSVKKAFSGNGHATKDAMWVAFEALLGQHMQHSVYHMCGMAHTAYKHTPHPIEDLVDAFAITLTAAFVYYTDNTNERTTDD
jgi:Holliday junction resolvasome RuvABC endonuclease subunit